MISKKEQERQVRMATILESGQIDSGNEAAEDDNEVGPEENIAESRAKGLVDIGKVTPHIAEQYHINPKFCRMWKGHNRAYELLSEARCEDLIHGFREKGRQEIPAIVREVSGDPNYRYEVICGARRHWTANHLGRDLYIEVRDLTDEEAFTLADIENRDRKDISDYERAVDYKRALGLYYGGKQISMAEALHVSEKWLSKFLGLAEMPKEIVECYKDINDLKESHYRELSQFFKQTVIKNKLIERAVELKEKRLPGPEIVKQLKAAGLPKKIEAIKPTTVKSSTGRVMMTIAAKKDGGAGVVIKGNIGAAKEEVLGALEKWLDENYE